MYIYRYIYVVFDICILSLVGEIIESSATGVWDGKSIIQYKIVHVTEPPLKTPPSLLTDPVTHHHKSSSHARSAPGRSTRPDPVITDYCSALISGFEKQRQT